MKNSLLLIALMLFAYSCTQRSDATSEPSAPAILPSPGNGGIDLPENFAATVVVDSLGRGRHLVLRENGDIYVHLRRATEQGNGIVALRDTTGDGRADIIEEFSEFTGTGIEIHKDHLYYSTQTRVYRSPFEGDNLLPSSKIDTLIRLVEGAGHMEKPFTFDGEGNIYVNVGSMSNACQEETRSKGSKGVDPCVELDTRAGIWRFDDEATDQEQSLDKRYATGIRNAVALSWNKEVNALYVAQHGRDDLHRFWPDLFTQEENLELPAEEFFRIDEGADCGWPYCYYNQFEQKKFLNPEYGGDGKITERCEGVTNPLVAFPGHWGPNDLLFYQGDQFPSKYKNGAFIAFHGSWNRLGGKQAGYNVVFIPMKDGKPTGDYEIFADGFTGTDSLTSPGDARFRPCGLAEGPDGSLYICDSQKGRIWRVMHYPDGVPEVEGTEEQADETVAYGEVSAALEPGKKVYDAYCIACHQANGKGAPGMNPPLVETDWVTGDKERLIGVILNGMSEPTEINGETYQNAMASHAFLDDQQIADVLTFIRNYWGNEAEAITAEEVAALRKEQ
jgi:glucose/arabinose dehydrogenase/cytochrome c553